MSAQLTPIPTRHPAVWLPLWRCRYHFYEQFLSIETSCLQDHHKSTGQFNFRASRCEHKRYTSNGQQASSGSKLQQHLLQQVVI